MLTPVLWVQVQVGVYILLLLWELTVRAGANSFELDPDCSISPLCSASPRLALKPVLPYINALCLSLLTDLSPPKALQLPSILNLYTPLELAVLLPPCLPPAELDVLLTSDTSQDSQYIPHPISSIHCNCPTPPLLLLLTSLLSPSPPPSSPYLLLSTSTQRKVTSVAWVSLDSRS
ncbi:hypothetical protein B0H14DRAFT_2564509 [Mycena olivaceomarginata]|nr:hypothetical protein B0H14DRAFT_2564509 [Mycena olivaceomarginata]